MKPRLLSLAVCTLAAVASVAAEKKSPAPIDPARTAARLTEGPADPKARLLAATCRHLDALLASGEQVPNLKGKSAAGMTALAFYLSYEATGNQRYRAAALALAERIRAEMKATKFGVLFVKEKEKGDGEEIDGGGPPALGWYASALAYVFHHEKKTAELGYVAGVLDRFPWNEAGWWAATIDIHTGQPKVPIAKPSPVNKTASLAMASGMTAAYLKSIDPELSARLRGKAERCLYSQVIPAQEEDGFWHYGLTGRDPKDKDVFGYFMLTTGVLIQLRELTGAFREEELDRAVQQASAFALSDIAPMTEPHRSPAPRRHATKGTPQRFTLPEDLKRVFQLAIALIGAGRRDEGLPIADAALKHFPYGNRGDDGAHAAHSTALLHRLLSAPAKE